MIAAYVSAEHGAWIGSDGITYRGDGIPIGLVTKTLPIPHLNCAIAAAGMGGQVLRAFELIDRAWFEQIYDFDQLVGSLEPLFRETLSSLTLEAHRRGSPVTDSSMFVVGLSARSGQFEGYKISDYEKGIVLDDGSIGPGANPFSVVPFDGLLMSSWPGDKLAEEFGLMRGPMSAAELVARAVCAGRANSGIIDGRNYIAGGFLQMTALDRNKVMSWIAHRWPDELGRPLDIHAGEAMPPMPLDLP